MPLKNKSIIKISVEDTVLFQVAYAQDHPFRLITKGQHQV